MYHLCSDKGLMVRAMKRPTPRTLALLNQGGKSGGTTMDESGPLPPDVLSEAEHNRYPVAATSALISTGRPGPGD